MEMIRIVGHISWIRRLNKNIYEYLIRFLVRIDMYTIDVHDVYDWYLNRNISLLILGAQRASFYAQKEAVIYLGELGCTEAYKTLAELLVLSSPEVVLAAIDSLLKLELHIDDDLRSELLELKEENQATLKRMRENHNFSTLGQSGAAKRDMDRPEHLRKQLKKGIHRFA